MRQSGPGIIEGGPCPLSGRYGIVARAADNAGDMQPAEDMGQDIYDGRTGWNRVPVEVLRTEAWACARRH